MSSEHTPEDHTVVELLVEKRIVSVKRLKVLREVFADQVATAGAKLQAVLVGSDGFSVNGSQPRPYAELVD